MTFDPNEVISFDFADAEPAAPGAFILIPSGEYQLQCNGARKYFTGEGKNQPDSTKPNIEFQFTIINHPDYQGQEMKLSHSLLPASRNFLLNTLMCLIPNKDWKQDGIKVPLGQLIQAVTGRPTNGVVYHDDFTGKDGTTVYLAKLKGLLPYDPTKPPPQVTDTNPPKYMLERNPAGPTQQQAASGVVSPQETQEFMNQWPGGQPPAPATSPQQGTADFGFDEPF